MALGVARGFQDRHSVDNGIAFGHHIHLHVSHHVGHVPGHGQVLLVRVAGIIDLGGIDENPGVEEEVRVLAVVPVHVSQDDEVKILCGQVPALKGIVQE